MKNRVLALMILSAAGVSCGVNADTHTVSLGYAQSKVQDFKKIDGVNAKYRYEWDSPFSLMTSLSYMSGSEHKSYLAANDIIDLRADVKYYSLAAGPAYRLNEYVSVYGLLGVNYSKVDYNYNWKNYDGGGYTDMGNFRGNKNSTNLVYSAGLQINASDNVTLDIAYEGSQINDGGKNHSVNGFNIGLGYRF